MYSFPQTLEDVGTAATWTMVAQRGLELFEDGAKHFQYHRVATGLQKFQKIFSVPVKPFALFSMALVCQQLGSAAFQWKQEKNGPDKNNHWNIFWGGVLTIMNLSSSVIPNSGGILRVATLGTGLVVNLIGFLEAITSGGSLKEITYQAVTLVAFSCGRVERAQMRQASQSFRARVVWPSYRNSPERNQKIAILLIESAKKGHHDRAIRLLRRYAGTPHFDLMVYGLENQLPLKPRAEILRHYARALREVQEPSSIAGFCREMRKGKFFEPTERINNATAPSFYHLRFHQIGPYTRNLYRNLGDYERRLFISSDDLERLKGRRLLLIGGGDSPIKKGLVEKGINCEVTNIDPAAKPRNRKFADRVIREDFFDSACRTGEHDEIWALFSLPYYALTPAQVNLFYIKALGNLPRNGILRVGPITSDFPANFTPSMRLNRIPVGEASLDFLEYLEHRPDLFELKIGLMKPESALKPASAVPRSNRCRWNASAVIKIVGRPEDVQEHLLQFYSRRV